MKTKILILIALIFFAASALADEYTSSHKFNPIHIERNKLLQIASEIFDYVQNVNLDHGTTEGYVELGRDDKLSKLTFPFSEDDFEKFPRISHDANISIVTADGPVSKLYLSLTDSIRIVIASGQNRDRVNDLIKLVDEKLTPYESYAGGPDFRTLLGIVGIFIYWIATLPIWFALKVRDEPLFIAISFFLLAALIWLPPWPTIYPGFMAGVEIGSFLERKTGLFTLFGLILALAIPVVSLFYRSSKKRKTS